MINYETHENHERWRGIERLALTWDAVLPRVACPLCGGEPCARLRLGKQVSHAKPALVSQVSLAPISVLPFQILRRKRDAL